MPDAIDTFEVLRGMLTLYAKHFTVYTNTDDVYDLQEERPGHRTQFAVVHRRPKGAVRFYFYPLHVFPDLKAALPPSVAAKIVSKSILKLEALSATDTKALAKLFAAAWARIAAIRALDATHPYYRKFDLEDTHALIARIAKTGVELRKNDVQVTLPVPPKKLPDVLAPRAAAKPGVLRFKTITPDEHAALGELLR